LTGDNRAAWIGAFLYALGPQAALRLAGNEHMPVVFSMPYPPLIGWALLEIATRNSGKGILILAMAVAAMSLTFNKKAASWLQGHGWSWRSCPSFRGCGKPAG
ncbi:MAG: hypothetical protein EBZ44_07385, partial [Verrucomicrobia bacterium]|nr:hypothetical protein [Verrucomicrobiota bacterium]